MTNRYVRSTDGNNTDTGFTWPLAKATLAGAASAAAAGDNIYISQVHSESTAGNITYNFAGTIASPINVICANDGATPPTGLETTGVVAVSGSNGITINGSIYCFGVTFQGGDTSGGIAFCASTNAKQLYEQCRFIMPSTSATGINPIGSSSVQVVWRNCNVKFGGVGQKITSFNAGYFHWQGGSIISGSTTPTVLFGFGAQKTLIENVDFSNFGNIFDLSTAPNGSGGLVIFRNIRVPSGWSGSLLNGTWTNPGRLEAYNVSGGANNYKIWIEDQCGSIRDEIVIARTGGAMDGTTPLTWKMSSNATARSPLLALASPEIAMWNETTGSAVTLTVEYLHDTNTVSGSGAGSASAFRTDQVWLEVSYLGTSAAPKGTLVSSQTTDILTNANDNPAGQGTGSWTTTGMTTPKSGKLSVTFTPQMKGFFLARIMVGGTSKTLYVDPKITVT